MTTRLELELQIEAIAAAINSYEPDLSDEQFDEYLDEHHPEAVVCGYVYSASNALKVLDIAAYSVEKARYIDTMSLECDEGFLELVAELHALEDELLGLEN